MTYSNYFVEVVQDDFYDLQGEYVAFSQEGTSLAREKIFTDADLTIANLLIWHHGLPDSFRAIRITELSRGEDWTIPWSELSNSILQLDFSYLRPLIGNWRIRLLA